MTVLEGESKENERNRKKGRKEERKKGRKEERLGKSYLSKEEVSKRLPNSGFG